MGHWNSKYFKNQVRIATNLVVINHGSKKKNKYGNKNQKSNYFLLFMCICTLCKLFV